MKTYEDLIHEIEILKHLNDVLSRDLKMADDEIDRLKAELHYMKEADGRPYVPTSKGLPGEHGGVGRLEIIEYYTPSLKTPPESK